MILLTLDNMAPSKEAPPYFLDWLIESYRWDPENWKISYSNILDMANALDNVSPQVAK